MSGHAGLVYDHEGGMRSARLRQSDSSGSQVNAQRPRGVMYLDVRHVAVMKVHGGCVFVFDDHAPWALKRERCGNEV